MKEIPVTGPNPCQTCGHFKSWHYGECVHENCTCEGYRPSRRAYVELRSVEEEN